MISDAQSNPSRFLIKQNGDVIRLGPVSESDRQFAEENGIKLAPDFIPADDVEKYEDTKDFADCVKAKQAEFQASQG